MADLGRLESVDLREAWESEDGEFTPWLAQDENISILSKTLDMELEVEAQEKNVGPFRADILCRDANSTDRDSWVLIENQLERTDHTHLGQLMTYAAGLHTVTIIWIARTFTDEHRAALDWLNEITGERFRFFGLEVELWRIGESLAAPKFNIVSKPNEWSREVGTVKSSTTGDSETGRRYRSYWTAFVNHLAERGSPLAGRRTPRAEPWLDFSVGRTHFWLSANVRRLDGRISVQLNLAGSDRTAHYHLVQEQQPQVEADLARSVEWGPPGKAGQVPLVCYEQANFNEEDDWPRQHEWLADTLERFDKVFRPLVKDLDAADWPHTDDE